MYKTKKDVEQRLEKLSVRLAKTHENGACMEIREEIGEITRWLEKEKQQSIFSAEKMYTFTRGYAQGAELKNTLTALTFARKAHKGQTRKGGEPYIIHPLTMVCNAIALGVKSDIVLAAILLHDVVEDCGVGVSELPVSTEVQDVVNLVTYIKGDGVISESNLKKAYYHKIAQNVDAIVVKLIDRCHNVSTMGGIFKAEKIEEYTDETREYILPLIGLAKEAQPEISSILFLLKYHIESVLMMGDYAMRVIATEVRE